MAKVCALVMAALVLTVEVAMAEPRGETAGVVAAVSGPVTVDRDEVTLHALRLHDPLYWRDVVEVRKGGLTRLLLRGKTTVTMRELSRLELREELLPGGPRYVLELISGKVRASVTRMLIRPGERVEIRTRNTVASVRGTDFVVETSALPVRAQVLGPLTLSPAAHGGGRDTPRVETIVWTLAGAVDVTNRFSLGGRTERIGVYEGARISGVQDPVRFHFTPEALVGTLEQLTLPLPR